MKKEETALFEQTFEELKNEGYFEDFNKKVERLRSEDASAKVKSYCFSARRSRAGSFSAKSKTGSLGKKSRAGSRASKLKVSPSGKKSRVGSRISRLRARMAGTDKDDN